VTVSFGWNVPSAYPFTTPIAASWSMRCACTDVSSSVNALSGFSGRSKPAASMRRATVDAA